MPPSDDTAPAPIQAHRPRLADWLDLLALLRLDEGARGAELRHRDRALGARVQTSRSRPERWLVAWVEARREPGDGAGQQTAEAFRWSATLLAVTGGLFGAAAAWGALSFQPQGRINVVAVLGALVGVPALLFVLALLNALPSRWRRVLPLIGREPEGGGWLQPARWALRALPAAARDRLTAVFGHGEATRRLAAPVQRWLLLSASQGAAVAFQLGALAAILALVVGSDLSFGWSTTLRVDPASAHRATSLIAAPWAWIWPDAVPSLELIERTRFFRIASRPAPGVAPEFYGLWWRFVVAAIVVYGLLPRLAFYVFVRARLRRGLVRAMLEAPGARSLLRRMQDPLVETLGMNAEDGAAPAGGGADPSGDGSTPWPEAPVVVSWAEALGSIGRAAPSAEALESIGHVAQSAEALESIGHVAQSADALESIGHAAPSADAPEQDGPAEPIAAGGRLAPRDDVEAAARAAALATERDRAVAVVVRAFEPPMLELVDFLAELRRQLGDGREIVVGLARADAAQARVWQQRLAAVGDPWLRCTLDVPVDEPRLEDASTPSDASEARPDGAVDREEGA